MNRFLNFRLTLFIGALFAIGTVAFLTITSCEKEKSSTFSGQETDANTPLTPSCENPCSDCGDDACTPKTVLEAVSDTGDLENHKVNMILYHYAQAVREAAKNPTFLQYMTVGMTVNNQGVTVSLHTLAQNNASFASFVNYNLRQSMAANYIYPRGVEPGIEALIADPTWDANTYLKNRLIYNGTPYAPVIYYKTKPVAGAENLPVSVLISQDVNDCDDVAGWRGDTPGLVGEAEGRSGNRVVIVVGPGAAGNFSSMASPTNISNGAEDRTSTVNMNNLQFFGSQFRYEKSSKSEVTGQYIKFAPGIPTLPVFCFYAKICKNSFKNMDFLFNGSFMVGDATWDSGSHYFVFYEQDWFSNMWDLPHPCTTSVTRGEMKYDNEWYSSGFCGAASTYFPSAAGGFATRINTKSRFDIRGQ
jgi:hypothetical protein